jgi:hypothetical protein
VLEDLITAYEAHASGEPLPAGFDEGMTLPERQPSAESLEFWKRHLDGYRADGLALWCDKEGDPEVTLAGEVHHHVLSPEAEAAVTRLRRELRAPKAVVLLSAYYLTLALHGAGPDLVVGVPASTRDTTSQKAVGYHVNMLPLRAGLGPDRTVREVAAEVRAGFFEALAHPDVPAETFLPQDRGDRPTWRNTLFRHVFNYVPTDFRNTFTVAGLPAVQHLVENGTSKYDLEFFLSESADTALLSVLFNTQVLDLADVTALVARYDDLLARLPEVLDEPLGELPRRSADDRPAGGPGDLWEAVREWAAFGGSPAGRAGGAGDPGGLGEPGGVGEPGESTESTEIRATSEPAADAELVGSLVRIWAEFLDARDARDAGDIGADSNFFSEGGHSLLGAQLVQRVKKATGAALRLADLFANPTPAAFAALLSGPEHQVTEPLG